MKAQYRHACVALNALRDVEHDVLGTRGVLYNTFEETTMAQLHRGEES